MKGGAAASYLLLLKAFKHLKVEVKTSPSIPAGTAVLEINPGDKEEMEPLVSFFSLSPMDREQAFKTLSEVAVVASTVETGASVAAGIHSLATVGVKKTGERLGEKVSWDTEDKEMARQTHAMVSALYKKLFNGPPPSPPAASLKQENGNNEGDMSRGGEEFEVPEPIDNTFDI